MKGCIRSSRCVMFVMLLVPGFFGSVWAADSPETLEEIRDILQRQQQIIDAQQDQIEALQQALGVRPSTSTVTDAAEASEPKQANPPEVTNGVMPLGTTLAARAAVQPAKAYRDGLSWAGYALGNYQQFDFFENVQDDTPENRGRTDLERFVLGLRYEYNQVFSFFAEIEFEHGGTGTTVEFEREETGEFESEIEAGGEVTLEQAYLEAAVRSWAYFRVGEIVVPFGMINTHHQPTQYFTLERSLAESALFPNTWHETGVSVSGILGQFRYEAQIISALDSSQFSGPEFVANGARDRLEFDSASDLALVVRADYALALGATVGASYYGGFSAGNRPRRNLAEDAQVSLYEAHFRFGRGPWTLRGQYVFGQIDDSDDVTRANLNTFNGGVLGVSRTPVGHQAEAGFIEGGYDVLSFFQLSEFGRLDLFGRYETYNTHAGTEGNIQEIARFDRAARTFGVNYKPEPGIVLKAEYSFRTHEGDIGDEADVYGLGFGVEF